MPKPNNKGLEPRSGTGKGERRGETYNEDRRGRIDPWELSEDGQVSKVVDGEVPQHPHRCERMEGIQKHHPYEKANRASGTGPLVDTRPHISTHAAGEKARTKDECPRSPARKGEAMRDTRMSQGKKTHLVCHGSLNPEIQYVYHCTTHVPYNTACMNHSAVTREFIEKKRTHVGNHSQHDGPQDQVHAHIHADEILR